ncbi:MAG TPA: hypothetical protein PKI61_00575 [bacterium]|nr:hypothetical protein [bacterium]HPT29382.1 hypothetical protein [bacterium]
MRKAMFFIATLCLCLASTAQNSQPVSKICDVGNGTLFSAPQGVDEYQNGCLFLAEGDVVQIFPLPGKQKYIEIIPGPNGAVVKRSDSILLRGKDFLYEGKPIDWFPCPQGILVEEIIDGKSQLSINGVRVIYAREDDKKIDWTPAVCTGMITAYIVEEKTVRILLADGTSKELAPPSRYWGPDKDGIIFEARRGLYKMDLDGKITTLYEGKYEEYCPSSFGVFWSVVKKGITNIYLNGELLYSDYCEDWGPCPQGLQIIGGGSVYLVQLPTSTSLLTAHE